MQIFGFLNCAKGFSLGAELVRECISFMSGLLSYNLTLRTESPNPAVHWFSSGFIILIPNTSYSFRFYYFLLASFNINPLLASAR